MLKADNNLSLLMLNADNRNEILSVDDFIIVYSCC
jgi:hypothetical protein